MSAKKEYAIGVDLAASNVSLNGTKLNAADLAIANSAVSRSYIDSTINNTPYEVAKFNGKDTMKVNGNLVIDDGTGPVDIGDFVKTMKARMLILQPNFEAHENYPALKDAYDQYKMLEKLMMESNNVKDD